MACADSITIGGNLGGLEGRSPQKIFTCFYSFKLSPGPSAPLSPLPTLSALPSCCPNRMSCCENCSTFSRWLPSMDSLHMGAPSPLTIVLVFSRFILRPYYL